MKTAAAHRATRKRSAPETAANGTDYLSLRPAKILRSAHGGVLSALSVARDGIAVVRPATSAGFAAARAGVDAAFDAHRRAVSWALRAAESRAHDDFGAASVAARSVAVGRKAASVVLDAAHGATKTGLRLSEGVARATLHASDSAMALAGAERGEGLRLVSEAVSAQRGNGTSPEDVSSAILSLASLLEVGKDLFAPTGPLRVIGAARELAEIHAERRQKRIERRKEEGVPPPVIPKKEELASLSRHMNYAAAAYGAQLIHAYGISGRDQKDSKKAASMTHEELIATMTGIPQSDIILLASENDLYLPRHFVALDRLNKEVVLSIRGTLSIHDVVVDLICQSEAFVTVYDGNETVEGKVHRGFLKSAQRLASTLYEVVARTLRENPDFSLVIVGHSLGGAIATLMALLWARIPLFLERNVHAFSYSSPCSVCSTLSRAPFTMKHITSVVFGDDVVSRAGLVTFRELQSDVMSLDLSANETEQDKEVPVLSPLEGEEKMFCAGRVWWLESKEYEPHPIVEIDPVEALSTIELHPNMFSLHLPNECIQTLDRL